MYPPLTQDSASPDPDHEAALSTPAGSLVPDAALIQGARLSEAVIDLGAIAANLRIVRAHTDAALMAVVKADGYGHGAVQVARTALAHGATWLGVSFAAEALPLRAAGITAPILTFMPLPDEDVAQLLPANVDLSVSTEAHLDGIAAQAARLGRVAQIHLKVDTGLHRNGASPTHWPALVEAAAQLEQDGVVHVRGIWSRLARPEEPEHPTTVRQLEAFDEAIRQAEAAGLTDRLLHIANSAAALAIPRAHYDMIRVGGAMYGIEPLRERDFGLKIAMTLRGRIIMTRRVNAGEGVSYEHCYHTPEASNLALLPIGYADGLPRAASGSAQVQVAGERKPIAGRIAMDTCVADVGQLEVAMGDEAVFFGPGTEGEPTVAEWAAWAGSNQHEVLTRIGPRVPRRHLAVDGEGSADMTEESAKPKLRIAVLFGGPGGEYDVSCASAATIVTGLDRERYVVQPVRISPEGRWIPGPTDWPAGQRVAHDLVAVTPDPAVRGVDHAQALAVLAAADVVIPALHGPFGEDGTVQALMDALGVRYVGSGMAASALGMDKDATKRVLTTSGIEVAEWVVLRKNDQDLTDADRERLGLPAFVKPSRGGSSVGVSRVKSWDDFGTALEDARKWDEKVLVERSVIGREVHVAVLEQADGSFVAGPVAETVLHEDVRDFLDYTAKYLDKKATDILVPAPLDPETTAELQRIAVESFEILGCRGLARVDFLLRDGVEPVFNEINTFPGFSATSLYPRMWATAGLPLPKLLDVMIEAALARVPA